MIFAVLSYSRNFTPFSFLYRVGEMFIGFITLHITRQRITIGDRETEKE